MASLCKTLRVARLMSANIIHRGGLVVVRRPLTASAYYSPCPPRQGLSPSFPREFQNIASSKQAADMEPIMEMREASPAHFLIKIDSFRLLGEHKIYKFETGEFKAGGYKWKLIIRPIGNGTALDAKNVSINLAMADTNALPPNWEVNASFSICLFNHVSGNYCYSLGKTRRFHPLKREWGFEKFISLEDLTDPRNGYLVDNSCVFGAEVFVNENKAVTECLSLKDTVPHKRQFRISNFSKLQDVWLSDEIWASEVFIVGGYKWKTSLQLNRNGKSLSLFLQRVDAEDSRERVKVSYTACLKYQGSGCHVKKSSSDWFASSKSSLGWVSFIDLASLNDPNKCFVVNDCCHLDIEVSVQAIAGIEG